MLESGNSDEKGVSPTRDAVHSPTEPEPQRPLCLSVPGPRTELVASSGNAALTVTVTVTPVRSLADPEMVSFALN